MPTAIPASTSSIGQAASARSPAWPTSGASSSTSSRPKARVIAEEAIKRIAGLYAVEKEGRGQPPDERVRLRQARAKPIVDDLESWLQAQLPKISGKSELAKAIRYALARMRKLRPYLEHGCLEADNNGAERALKPVALGRKNFLFVGSEGGGKSAAIAYTLIEKRQAQRHQSASLAHRRAGPDRRPQDHSDRRTAALALRCRRSVTRGKAITPDGPHRTLSMYLWRAVDFEGEVLDMLVQSRRDKAAALRLMCKLLKNQGTAPLALDRLKAYGSAARELDLSAEHIQGKRKNNRAEGSHVPIRLREREARGNST